MKKTKKILSLILAIIMIVSTMPMAFALDIKHDYDFNFDFDALADACFDAYVNVCNIYLPVENVVINNTFFDNEFVERIDSETINYIIEAYYEYVFSSVMTDYPDIPKDPCILLELNANPEVAEALTTAIVEGNKKIEDTINKGDLTVHIDRRQELKIMQECYQTFIFSVSKDASIEESLERKWLEIYYSGYDAGEILINALYEPENYTQVEYDLAIADYIDSATQFLDCCKLIHSDPAFINNTDGTHTTICSFCYTRLEETATSCSYTDGKCICGAEEPIVEEDTTVETPDNNNSTTDNKEEPERKTFFQKIADFFKNIFNKLFGWMKK